MAQLEDPKQLSLKQLARCPLVLLGLCIIFQRTGSLHTDEARLYRTLSVLLVSRWSQIKGIAHTSTVLEVEISPLLGWLAVKMLEKDQIFIERSQLLDNITEYLMQEMGLSSSFLDCHHTSLAILQMLISKTGIWVEKSQEIYAFFHLRLQKSLAAQHISCRVKHSRKSAVYNKGIKFSLSKTGRALGNPPPTEHSLAHKIRHRLTYKSVTA